MIQQSQHAIAGRSLLPQLTLRFTFYVLLALLILAPATQATPPAQFAPSEPLPAGASVQTVVPGLGLAVSMAFDPAGRLFFTQKNGAVRLIVDEKLQPEPVIRFAVDTCSERGLLGIALDPQFAGNHYVYVYYTAASDCGSTMNRVVRFVEKDGRGSEVVEIFNSAQSAGNHDGGNIHFGPDGKLYVSVGDNANAANAQNLTVRQGKLHRLNPDGSMPGDNPRFGDGALPSLYAIGLRNSFDFTFDPASPYIFASENGPGCDDEMNRIIGGYNYGWRADYPCDNANPDRETNTIPALWYLPKGVCCIAPTGIEVYRGDSVTAWKNSLFMCNYNNAALIRFQLSADRTKLLAASIIDGVRCNMDIQTGPDGALYYFEGGGYSEATLKRITGPAPVATIPPVPPTATPAKPGEADPWFQAVWDRVDRPVREGVAVRSWIWGPQPRASEREPFGTATRLVQYYDKARMELNEPVGDGPTFVSNGLLVVELISGRVQVGPDAYQARPPATLPIGGDGANNPAPSYAALARVASLAGENKAPATIGAAVTATLDANGAVGSRAAGPEQIGYYAPETGHNIPATFMTFLTQRGPVYVNGEYREEQILDWVYTVGYPITEPYWTRMSIGGEVRDVLVQAFQRQVLTYIPGYSAPWHVQFGNVGIQYYQWRYGRTP